MSKSKKTNTRRKTKRNRNKKNMKGGRYTQEQQQQLLNAGFTPDFLQIIDRAKVAFGLLWTTFEGSGMTAQQYMQQTYNDLDLNPEEGFTDAEDNDDDDNDEQNGGRKRTSKRRKTKKTKKNKTRKQLRRIKGGAMFGNGYGANCNDPNYSIYNTNLLKLFPYSPK